MSYHPPRRLQSLFVGVWLVLVALQLGVILIFTGAFLYTKDGITTHCDAHNPISLELWGIVAICTVGVLLVLQVVSFLFSFQVDTYCIQTRTDKAKGKLSVQASSVYLAGGEYDAVPLAVAWPYPISVINVVLISVTFLFHVVWTVVGTLWYFDEADCMETGMLIAFGFWFAVQYTAFVGIILGTVAILIAGLLIIYYLLGRIEDLEAKDQNSAFAV